ncbi:peptide deformylase [Zobellia uliginosa]|uniref:peptide deformylase n=1 Tax=Zobellia uliginosa TaxID=143224 RepID=UPI0026E1F681|nr:peptide deformylase [Zobellia uliginosa]MDO6515666.1 peptide deformylase [Zobellia uliginosa]
MAVLEVIKMGNPLLRKVSEAVDIDEIKSDDFQGFVDDLITTMRNKQGVGIAAPQVGVLKRVFTMEAKKNERYPDKKSFPLSVVINPTIETLSDEMIDSWEGCLSIPGIRGRLKRYKTVKLSGYDIKGNRFEKVLDDFSAIVAQHELDHLNGVLLIDRMPSMETLSFQEEYDTYWNV